MQNKNTENTATRKETVPMTGEFPSSFNSADHRVEINQDGDECVVTLLLNSPDNALMKEAVQSITGFDDVCHYDFGDGVLRLSHRLFMPSGFDEHAISYTVSTLEAAADLIQITCGFLRLEGC